MTRISEGIVLADARDASLTVLYANPAYEELTGYSSAELVGRAWRVLQREDDDALAELEKLKGAIERSEPCELVLLDVRKDGTAWRSHVAIEPLYSPRGELKYYLCIQKPASASESSEPDGELDALQRARQKNASLDRVDPATGLLRLGYFEDLLRRDLAVARRDQRFVTLLLFEIVDFEAYRQTFGGKAADSCQRMIGAQVMRTLRRAGDLCARYDDSTIVASVLGQAPEEAQRLAEQIAENVRRLGLHNPRAKGGRYVTVRSAIIGCPPGAEEEPDALIARAQAEVRAASVDESPAALP